MKIVKAGRQSPEWSREFECEGCGTVVSVERADLYKRRTTTSEDSRRPRDTVVADCVCCKRRIVVQDHATNDWGDLPEHGVQEKPQDE